MQTVEQLVDIPGVGFPIWSPRGDVVAYLYDQPGVGWQLATYNHANGERGIVAAQPLIPSQPAWLPDGSAIAVVRGNGSGGTDIVLVALAEGAERLLVGGAVENRSPSFSPDGATLAYLSGAGDMLNIWSVAIAGGEPQQLTQDTNPLDEVRWTPRWSPDGQWIAYVSSRSGERNNDDLWIVSADGNQHRQLTTGLIVNTDAAWSPDSRSIAVIGNTSSEHWYGDDADVWRVDTVEGPSRRLTPAGGHSWRLEGGGISWSPDGSAIYALSQQRGDRNITAIPADGGVRTSVTDLHGAVTDFAVSPDGATFAIIYASQTSPSDLYLLPAGGGRAQRVTDCHASVGVELKAPEKAPYRSFDGLYCDAYLYLPPDFDESRTYPGLIQVHGGGTNAYGNGWHAAEQWFALQGYVVLAIEYRGSSSYSREFANLSYADWGGGQTQDSVAAGHWLAAQPYISRIGIYGGSYGGYMTLHSIVAAPELFSGAVDMFGNTNMFTQQRYADRVGRVFMARDYFGRYAPEIPELMERASTYHSLSRIKTPLLILHGDKDARVPPIESQQVAEYLAGTDVPHEYVSYPGEGHGFRQRGHRIDCYTRMLGWFDHYIRQE